MNENFADKRTIEAYEASAEEFASHLESGIRSVILESIIELFQPGSRLLEIGCGIGADAEAMQKEGFDVTAIDASKALLEIAVARRPILTNRLLHVVLPDEELPIEDNSFDGVLALTVLQHLPLSSLPQALKQIRRVLRPGGRFMVRVFDYRLDLDSLCRDPKGRLQTQLPPEVFLPIAEQAQYKFVSTRNIEDILKRDFVRLREYILEK